MSGPRAMALGLPAIRCSDCGIEVDLSMMGDHICQRGSETAPSPHLTYAQTRSKSPPSMLSENSFDFKQSRAPPPPRIQTHAIGRPLVAPNELTPASSGHGSHAFSPRSTSASRSPFRAPSRGMTMPSRARPPSPELSNLDCAFPPWPSMASRSTTPVSDSKSQNSDKESIYVRDHAEPYNKPSSRRGSTSSSAARNRSNTLGNGNESNRRLPPAGGDRRPSLAGTSSGSRAGIPNVPPLPSPLFNVASRQSQHDASSPDQSPALGAPTLQPPQDAGQAPMTLSKPVVPRPVDARIVAEKQAEFLTTSDVQQTAASHKWDFELDGDKTTVPIVQQEQVLIESMSDMTGPAYRSKRPPSLATVWNQDGEAGPRSAWERPQASPSRSQTFPLPPGDGRNDNGPTSGSERRPSEPTVSFHFPRPAPLAVQDFEERPSAATAIPTNALVRGHPFHSPSDSASSYGSVNSVAQSHSSRSSQPSQVAEPMKGLDSVPPPAEVFRTEADILTPPKAPATEVQVDSPTDPAFQQGHLTPIQPPPLHRTQTTPEIFSQHPNQPSDDMRQTSPRPQLLRSKTAGVNKGQCRGCSKMILANQKSVSSADGRLTGRYHKECFACTTCHGPFATADFYVLRDQPYCAQHYHALNGTLCGGCGRGIEGQYLEAVRSKAKGPEKFHSKCFTCVMCRVVLQGDYFEHHGRFFCEKDIHRVATPPNRSPNLSPANRVGAGGNNFLSAGNGNSRGRIPERRSTKLMIMS